MKEGSLIVVGRETDLALSEGERKGGREAFREQRRRTWRVGCRKGRRESERQGRNLKWGFLPEILSGFLPERVQREAA